MPLFDFQCPKCNKTFEALVKNKDDIVGCDCGYIAYRQFPNTFNFKLKGDGWAKDLYTKPNK